MQAAALAREATGWLIRGGPWLFVAGHLAFKLTVWRTLGWPRVLALACLALLGLAAPHVSALVLNLCAALIVIAVAVADCVTRGQRDSADCGELPS